MIINAIMWIGGLGFWVAYIVIGLISTIITLKFIAPRTYKSKVLGEKIDYYDEEEFEITFILGLHFLLWPIFLIGLIVFGLLRYVLMNILIYSLNILSKVMQKINKKMPTIKFEKKELDN